jgi:Restriction endonuclease
MAKGFPKDQVAEMLVACHRRCCICHRFCGVKIEIDHIVPSAEGGHDTIDNAISVCFECHAEIHSYNDKHPRGRKFHPEELRKHKDQWLEICRKKPDVFINAARNSDVGPLQAMVDELEFNSKVAQYHDATEQNCLFLEEQFHRAIHEGVLSTLDETLKQLLLEAYRVIGKANQLTARAASQGPHSTNWGEPRKEANQAIHDATPKILEARDSLLKFLGSE